MKTGRAEKFMDANATVLIHGKDRQLAGLQPLVDNCRKRQWRRQRWTQRDALVQRGGGMVVPYIGQPYDPAVFEMVPGGWKRSLCEICGWELFASGDEKRSMGYTDGRQWICSECYDHFFRRL